MIQEAAAGLLTLKEAASLLRLSPRQVLRLKQRWLQDNSDVLEHRNRGLSKPWKVPENVRQQIVNWATKKYPNVSDTQLHALLVKREKLKISRESVRRILREAGVASLHPRSRQTSRE